jgi:hypothetical protein
MKGFTHRSLVAAAAVALAGGCQHPRTARIQEHAALFASLPPNTQQIVKDGLVDYGFTPELVYMALGKANRKSANDQTAYGPVETWVYRNFVYSNVGAVRISGNTPGSKPYGPVIASSAPGGPSLSSTKASPVQPTIGDGTDAAVGTLVLEFRNGRVVTIRVEP